MWKELIIKVKVINQKKNKKEVDLYMAYYKYKLLIALISINS